MIKKYRTYQIPCVFSLFAVFCRVGHDLRCALDGSIFLLVLEENILEVNASLGTLCSARKHVECGVLNYGGVAVLKIFP